MLYGEMKDSMKGKFRRRSTCKICGKEITRSQDCQFIQVKCGRSSYFNFLHTDCLLPQRMRMTDAELTSREG